MKKLLFFFLICNINAAAQKSKATTTPAKTQAKKPIVNEVTIENIPGFVSPVIPIPYKGLVVAPSPAQAKDYLLWYKGKKVNDSILITTDAKLVLYSKSRDMVVVQPSPKKADPTLKIIKEMANTHKRKDEFYNKMAERKSSVMMYPAIVNTLYEYDRILKRFEDMVKNYIKLPPSINATASVIKFNSSGYATVKRTYVIAVPGYIKRAYDEVIAAKKNYPPIDFPAPPARDFGACVNCDTAASSKQDRTDSEWQQEFVKYEAGIVTKSQSIIKTLSDLQLESDLEAVQMIAGLNQAMEFANARIDNKIDLLIRKYGNDFTRLSSVVRAAISAERQKQLLGTGGVDTYSRTMTRLLSLFEVFDKYLEQQIAARNYDVVLNMAFIIGMERQRQLLNASEENNIPGILEKINAFNRFKVEMEIDYNSSFSNDCGRNTDNAKAKTVKDHYVSLGVFNCKFGLYPAEQHVAQIPNYHSARDSYLELIMHEGTNTEKGKDDQDRCQTQVRNTAGDKLRPNLPLAKISFCENGESDSLIIMRLNTRFAELKYGESRIYESISVLFDEMPLIKELSPDVIQEYRQINNLLKEYERTDDHRLKNSEMGDMYHITTRKESVTEALGIPPQSYILFDAKNRDETLIDAKATFTYSRDKDEDTDFRQRKAEFKIKYKVTHDPLPYKKAETKKN